MITLGLGKIILRRHEPLPWHGGLETLSETVKRLEPSSVVLQALSETVAWCIARSLPQKLFRSRELNPSGSLRVPEFDELGVRLWAERKRESYQLAVNTINAIRSSLIRDTNIEIANPAVAESKGRLLLYEPLETVTDGASEASSRGFFDIEDAPPWDMWFVYSAGSILSWVPESLIQTAQAGIDANPVDCIHWCKWSKFSKHSTQ